MQSEITNFLGGKAGDIYHSVLSKIPTYQSPQKFIETAYDIYQSEYPNNPSINGCIIATRVEYEKLLAKLAYLQYCEATEILPITGTVHA